MFHRRIVLGGSLFLLLGLLAFGMVCSFVWWVYVFCADLVIAFAIQHVCLAKALMLIRELEGWEPSMRHLEQPVRLKVCSFFLWCGVDSADECQNEIIENLNFIFGIALSADDDPPLRITASHVLRACKSDPTCYTYTN